MERSEGFLIKKRIYRESDLILTFFTKERGKISGQARNAKKSKKRFGGRLEPFILLDVHFSREENRFDQITDVEFIRAFSNLYDNIESFLLGSFIIEYVDILTAENEASPALYDTAVKTFEKINSDESSLPAVLCFQLNALSICGYEPEILNTVNSSNEISVKFTLSGGGEPANSYTGTGDRDNYRFHTDIIKDPALMEINLSKVAHNIKVLTRYTEYHTEKKFRTSKFLEDLNL